MKKMLKSKREGINGILILFMILIGFAFLFYAFGLFDKQEFNPEKDVCEEYNCYDKTVSLDNYGNCNGTCIKWHTMNKCELNINDVNCVCDEYEEEIWQADYWYIMCDTNTGGGRTITGNKSYVEYEFNKFNDPDGNCRGGETLPHILSGNSSKCIKSHKKTLKDLTCAELLNDYSKPNIHRSKLGNDKEILIEFLKRC